MYGLYVVAVGHLHWVLVSSSDHLVGIDWHVLDVVSGLDDGGGLDVVGGDVAALDVAAGRHLVDSLDQVALAVGSGLGGYCGDDVLAANVSERAPGEQRKQHEGQSEGDDCIGNGESVPVFEVVVAI